MTTTAVVDSVREKVLQDYRKKLLEHKEVESRLKESEYYLVIYYVDPLFCNLNLGNQFWAYLLRNKNI